VSQEGCRWQHAHRRRRRIAAAWEQNKKYEAPIEVAALRASQRSAGRNNPITNRRLKQKFPQSGCGFKFLYGCVEIATCA
jgi:hypothetical protein